MPVAARQCPSCGTTLADEASFCHKCGASTPHAIDQATGEMLRPSGAIDPEQRDRLQRALGETYEVRRLLGRGGFAEVYVAFDKRLKREIAVKTIRSDVVSSDSLRQRFQSEAEAVAALRHPNVIPIYSVGESEDVAYFTMPLIEGDSLARTLERDEKLPIAEACRIIREAAHALHAAHRAGIVHRDVKPENVMLEGPDCSVVVMDFGIAKSGAGEGKGVTATGMLIGTPEYMSPEQAMGERTLDHRSDQYSLALVAYRMLSGTLPFEGESLQTRLFKIVTEVPTPLIEVTGEIPKPISDAVAKALSKSPKDRFESIADFAKAIDVAPAAEATTATSRRRSVAFAERVATMESAMRAARTWLVIGAVVLIGGIWLKTRSIPAAGLAIAASRPDAEFTARQFLMKHVGENRRVSYPSFVSADTVQRVIQRVIGFDSLQARAQHDIPVWVWSITFPSADRKDNWVVDVGPNNRVTGFLHVLNDSARGPALTVDSARAVALGELVTQGWDASTLKSVRDSTITRRARTDHEFAWQSSRGAVALGPRDSAMRRISVTVSGASVSRYQEQFLIPDTEIASLTPPTRVTVTLVGVGALCVVLSFLVLVIWRQRVDTLQWAAMTRIAAGICLLPLVATLATQIRQHAIAPPWTDDGNWTLVIVGWTAMLFVAGGFIATGAAAESLAIEVRPSSVAGVDQLSRGMFLIPEIVPGVVFGTAIGAIMFLIFSLNEFIAGPMGLTRPRSGGLTNVFAAFPVLTRLGESLLIAGFGSIVLLFAAALTGRVRRAPTWAVPIVPALVVSGMGAVFDSVNAAPLAFMIVYLATYAVWRFGMIAGLVAIATWAIVNFAVPLVMTDLASFRLSGVFLLLILTLPLLVAVRGWQRLAALPTALDDKARSHA